MVGPTKFSPGDIGPLPAQAYPARARFQSGNGRLGEVRSAADIPVGVAGGRGKVAAFLLETGIPALLRRGALEALGWQLGVPRNVWMLNNLGVDAPLQVNRTGH